MKPNILKQLFLDHGGAYQAAYGLNMPHAHKKVIYAIEHCGIRFVVPALAGPCATAA